MISTGGATQEGSSTDTRFGMHKIWGSFLNPETETAYRNASREEQDKQLIVAIAMVALFFIIFLPLDYIQKRIDDDLRPWILAIRGVIALCGFAYCFMIRSKPSLIVQDLTGLAYGFLILGGFSVRTYLANVGNEENPIIGVSGLMLMLGVYLFVTLRLKHMTIMAVFGAVVFISVTGMYFDLGSAKFVNTVIWSVVINTLGWITARRLQRSSRLEYKNYIMVSEANQQLVHEISERREAEKQVIKAKEAAEVANQAKTRFLAAASHDLRQPLHAIGMFVTALEARVREEKSAEIITKLGAAVTTTNELFETILDISKLDAGGVKPEIQVFRLQDTFEKCRNFHTGPAFQKGLTLKVVGSSLVMKSDPYLVERILNNLVTNAIRYSSTGKILVGTRRQGKKAKIFVYDTGQGIPWIKLDKIFGEFEQLEGTERDRKQGLGLGLSISKRIAILLGSDIEVTSEVGKGSCFCFELPLGRAEDLPIVDEVEPQAETDLLKGKTFMVVDDDLEVRDGMEALLTQWDCETISVSSIEEAVEKVATNGQPHFVIADYQLGNQQTGIQAISAIQTVSGISIPAIVVTGAMSNDILSAIEASGFSALHKPLQADVLRHAIEKELKA